MSVTVTELWDSGDLGGKSGRKGYLAQTTASETEATVRAAVVSEAPATYGSLVLDDVTVERLNDADWTAEAIYTQQEAGEPEAGDCKYSFSTRGGTIHINYGLGTEHSYAASGSAPDFKDAICVTDDGVQGTDIIDRAYEWTQTHYIDDDDITTGYISDLYDLTGCTNNASFTDDIGSSFDAGEVLFLGAEGTKLPNGVWEVSQHFAARPNTTTLSIGDISSINKEGWEYLWIFFEEVKDTTANITVRRPLYVFVERVYDEGDFSKLVPS